MPRGEFLLFQTRAELQGLIELPIFPLDSSALVSIDGAFYGTLLDHDVDPKELAQQISTLDQLLHLEQP